MPPAQVLQQRVHGAARGFGRRIVVRGDLPALRQPDPDSGLLGYRPLASGFGDRTIVQYWESREKLLAYAADQSKEHRPAWAAFNRRARGSEGSVGIWHETYVVPAGSYESIYVGMPAHGLGAAYGTEPVARRGERAAQRFASA
ncbi:DUF4188 domain-containing protein [Streptomyces roseifaciens]